MPPQRLFKASDKNSQAEKSRDYSRFSAADKATDLLAGQGNGAKPIDAIMKRWPGSRFSCLTFTPLRIDYSQIPVERFAPITQGSIYILQTAAGALKQQAERVDSLDFRSQPKQNMATSLVLRLDCDGDLADKTLGTVRGSTTAVPAELHPRMEPGSRKGAEISPDLGVAAHRCSTGRPWGFPALARR